MFAVIKLRKFIYFAVIIFVLSVFAVIHGEFDDERELVVLMYHSVLKDTSRSGKYIVTPDSLESDIKYLNSHGYVSVLPSDIISYVYDGKALPEKPYLITFDDGSYNNLTYVLPILERNDAYALISVVGSYSENFSKTDEANAAYSYLRWSDIDELIESGRVEIGNHSYDFHSITKTRTGAKIARYEDENEYIKRFTDDTEKTENLLENNCGFKPIVYAYPYGAYCKQSETVLDNKGYKMTFTCEEGKNLLSHNPECLKLLKRYNRSGNAYTDVFFLKRNIK